MKPDPHIRTAIAALAMQAVIGNLTKGDIYSAVDTAATAVEFADALLAELAKGQR